MINSFANDDTQLVFTGLVCRSYPSDIQATAYRKLAQLHNAANLSDVADIPGNRFEKLKGDRLGQYSIRINNQWRICFAWGDDKNAYDVEIVDYH